MSLTPWIAAFLSLLVPGLGQVVNRQWAKAVGFVFIDVWIIYVYWRTGFDMWYWTSLLIAVVAIVDAYHHAKLRILQNHSNH